METFIRFLHEYLFSICRFLCPLSSWFIWISKDFQNQLCYYNSQKHKKQQLNPILNLTVCQKIFLILSGDIIFIEGRYIFFNSVPSHI